MPSAPLPKNLARKLVPVGTSEPITNEIVLIYKYIRIYSDPGNTANVFIGDMNVNVTDSGYLIPKDVITFIDNDLDPRDLYCISASPGQYLRIEVR